MANPRPAVGLRACLTQSSRLGGAWLALVAVMLCFGSVLAERLAAQEAPSALSAEQAQQLQNAPPEVRAKIMEQMQKRGMPMPQPGGEQPKPEDKKDGEKKPEGGDKKEEGGTIKRPTDDKAKGDAAQLKVKPVNGKVEFNFRDQPWKDVLEWYAGIANLGLDWQELPGDQLNLLTPHPLSLAETRDLLNRHLLARKFTMVIQPGGLQVVKLDQLEPSLVPSVSPAELDDHTPYEFVKTRFSIPEAMDPAKAVEDVKILLSPKAKVTPLLQTKQIQAMDIVANLRDVRDLLEAELLNTMKDVRPRPFIIRHRRADYIADQVMIILGLDPQSRKNPMELQLEQQRMQLMMQMQQRGTDISKMLKQDGPAVFIAVDKRRNLVLVNAPPKEMAMIERAITQFDVPEDDVPGGVGTVGAAADADRTLTLEKYPTNSTDAVVTALKELGTLDPLTQLQSDRRADVIFAYATKKDHEDIKRMIEKLDGEGRGGYMVPINRRMSAEQVAGTIQALLVGEKKEEDNNSRSRYFFYDPWGRNNEDEDNNDGDFRVQADIENNRILLWANESEYKEVMKLLETMGAVAATGNRDRMRVWEAGSPQETAKLLEQLQQTWNGKNKLDITMPAPQPKPAADDAEKPAAGTEDKADEKKEEKEPRDKLTVTEPALPLPRQPRAWLAQFASPAPVAAADVAAAEAAAAEAAEPADAPPESAAPAADAVQKAKQEEPAASDEQAADAKPTPPVKIRVTEDGRILLYSDDPAALDQIEELMAELETPQKEFEAFYLKTADALDVWYNLKEYFEDELKGQTEPMFDMWGEFEGRRKSKSGPASLGRRRLLRFIYDLPTNSIVVQNASEAQLQVIRQLIKIYDQPIGEDSVAKRRTEAIQIKYSRAQQIAAALKEVYRDLLSSKDKEFQNRDGEKQTNTRTETYFRFYGGGGDEGSDAKSSPVKVAFEGALSIGVDEISNTLIISAEENVFNNVKELITLLDMKAKPNTVVQVYELRGTHAKELKAALATALSRPWPGGKPEAGAPQQQGGENGEGDRGERRRGRNRDRDNDNNNND